MFLLCWGGSRLPLTFFCRFLCECCGWAGCHMCLLTWRLVSPQIAKSMGPTWGPPGSCRPQMGPMLAPWTLLSGTISLASSLLVYIIGACMIQHFARFSSTVDIVSWWHHQMETSPVNSPHKGQRSFHVFFDLRLNKRLSKQSWGWWFDTLSRPLWRYCNVSNVCKNVPGLFSIHDIICRDMYDYCVFT